MVLLEPVIDWPKTIAYWAIGLSLAGIIFFFIWIIVWSRSGKINLIKFLKEGNMLERHFKKILFALILLVLGYAAHITRYETLRAGYRYPGGNIRTDGRYTNGYFVRDRWTNQIKWIELK